jgi:hypothetical protein
MDKDITKKLMCIQVRSGVEIWAEADRVKVLQDNLYKLKNPIFVNYEGQTINTADITGIFTAETMSNHTQRRNGRWQCEHGNWHDKFEKCACISREEKERSQRRWEAIKACGKCNAGWVNTKDGSVAYCDCIKNLK